MSCSSLLAVEHFSINGVELHSISPMCKCTCTGVAKSAAAQGSTGWSISVLFVYSSWICTRFIGNDPVRPLSYDVAIFHGSLESFGFVGKDGTLRHQACNYVSNYVRRRL